MSEKVVKISHSEYIHVQDNNTNATTLLCGPVNITLQSHQAPLLKPTKFEVIPPQHYMIIENPVVRDPETNQVVCSANGQAKNRLDEREVRTFQQPFPLYPGEVVIQRCQKIPLVKANCAVVLRAVRTFTDRDGVDRKVGDEYLFFGPGMYTPNVNEEIVESRDPIVVGYNQNVRLRAKNKFVDRTGTLRQVGEEYLWSKPGAFVLGVDEQLLETFATEILTADRAIHVSVTKRFFDSRPWVNKERFPGETYLVDHTMCSEFVPQPQETVVCSVNLITVSALQFVVILDPVGPNGKPQLGQRKVASNTSFFLHPGERLDGAIRDAYILTADEAVLVRAVEEFEDKDTPCNRVSGEQWLLRGPRVYIPNESVTVVRGADGSEKRSRLILGPGDGVYVRDTITGDVRAVTSTSYMLEAYEELWAKDLPAVVEEKLALQLGSHASYMDRASAKTSKRDKTRLVTYHIPHNSVTQVFDYKRRTRRTIFGPDLVALGPDDEFSVLSLSGSDWDPKQPTVCLPKQTDKIKALYLFLGPSNLSDVVLVETRDHARLSLQLSYDWRFDVNYGDTAAADQCFNVPDFVGDCCSCIASRVRASIASISFEHFHKNSAKLLRAAVFGLDESGAERSELRFPSNRLVVTSVDIQQIEVVDEKTREALKQSVKMAIEITTQAQEAFARQEASVREQTARGKLERQQIQDKSLAEVERKQLIEAEAQCSAISSTGRAKAEAKARAQAINIDGDLSVQLARKKAQRVDVMEDIQLELKQKRTSAELDFVSSKNQLEVQQQDGLAVIESSKFRATMDAVGKGTVQELAKAGPEMQAKILASLGLEGYLVTDGTNPINLFNTAKGLTASGSTASAAQASA
eukprot:CAMPEP_0176429096 /NCGR_PEP_ID=MMETSP0127-20121128/13520_1 /TAXON_ID=938130 /ORGANISM="Platyophrya macrostoma, Strain WH" /LENGTH=862 /DNA_ID=CAMNT_0017810861 /DNA_START=61 /DNA_END=2649 /DNA_ORIENTATION=-